MIPFNKPYLHGRELVYIADAVASGKISGDGIYTNKCHQYFESRYKFRKTLMTTSCTDALEMCSLLLNIAPGDEVIVPSFTFVSTANAFARAGAKIVFADSMVDLPNIDADLLEGLITPKTKAIVVVHYAGIACDMDPIIEIANRYGLAVIEDAAQAIDSYYKNRPLGGLGDFGTFSFHETKNIISGEGGLLVINDASHILRAEIIREKGTNRSSFFRGEVNKYGWVDIGSSFLPSDIISAYLYAQLENLDAIQKRRREAWDLYRSLLSSSMKKFGIDLPLIPSYATNNAHMFYLVCRNIKQRNNLIESLRLQGVHAVFHYLSLHASPYFHNQHDGRVLENSDKFQDRLVRLPLYYEITNSQIEYICEKIIESLN